MQDDSSRKWEEQLGALGIRPEHVMYYLQDPPEILHPCSVDQCVEKFRWDEFHNHLITAHRGISRYPDLTCKTCRQPIKAKYYKEHLLTNHSGRSLRCAYCNGILSREKLFPRHFETCPGLSHKRFVTFVSDSMKKTDTSVEYLTTMGILLGTELLPNFPLRSHPKPYV